MPATKQTKKTEEQLAQTEEKKAQSTSKKAQSTSSKKAPSKKAESKKAPSKKAESKKKEAPAPKAEPKKRAPKAEAPVATNAEAPSEQTGEKKRRVVTKESLNGDFLSLAKMITDEIERLRTSTEKSKGIKFLKSLNKVIRTLHNDANRITKFRKTSARKNNTSSGFLKPVNISEALAKFTGFDKTKTYSRTEVTKFICSYIKEKKLFDNSEDGDKRNILVDAPLQKLLNYDPKNPPKDEDGKSLPLTYFRLQQYLKVHFLKPTAEVTVEDEDLDE